MYLGGVFWDRSLSFTPSFSSGIPLLGLVHGEGKGEAISSSWPVWVGTLSLS
jgi:hypothetical protein